MTNYLQKLQQYRFVPKATFRLRGQVEGSVGFDPPRSLPAPSTSRGAGHAAQQSSLVPGSLIFTLPLLPD